MSNSSSYKKWYSPYIYETYLAALQEYTGLSMSEVQERGSNAAHTEFRNSFTPEITKSYEKTKKHYAESDHYIFRNPPYFRGRLPAAFGKYADVIKADLGPVLDYGCGAGVVSEFFYREGITDITLTDLQGKTWDFVKFFFGDRVKYEKDVENIKGKYKYIFSNSVLEHIHDPLKVVNMWEKHLLPGGKILGDMAKDIGGEHLEVAINQYDAVAKRVAEINKTPLISEVTKSPNAKTTPEISVVISTYNRPQLLQRAVNSVLNQTFRNFEIVVVDDHSDKLPNLVLPKGETRVTPIRLPFNTGYQTRPKNVGIMCSKGKYIAYLDDDNVYLPDHLETLHKAITKTGADVVYGDRVYKSTNPNERRFMGKQSLPFDLNQINTANYIDTSDVMHTIQAINDIGFWDIFWERKGDWLLMVRFGKAGKKIVHVPKIITEYHWNETNIGQVNPLGGKYPRSTKDHKKHIQNLARDVNKI